MAQQAIMNLRYWKVVEERDKARDALKLVLALNRQPISACVPKLPGDKEVYGNYYCVDLDPQAEEQIRKALQ